MRLICLLAVFVLSFVAGFPVSAHASPAKLYRLGVPQGPTAPPYKWLFDGLEKKGFVVGENLKIVPIDLTKYQEESGREKIRQELANKCDLFFAGGAAMEILFAVEPHSPLLFLNIAGPERAVPATMQANTTGVRLGSEAGIFKQAVEMLPADQRRKLGLISFKGSKIALMTAGFQKSCAQLGIELVLKEYADQENIASVMHEFKAEGVHALLLFPPAFRKNELPELIKWQHRLNLPIISLIRQHVERGLFGGTTISNKMVTPSLADYAAKILQGRSPGQLPVKYFSPKYVVNLATASRLGIEVPAEVVSRADIVGLARFTSEEETTTRPLVPGYFDLGVARNTEKKTVKKILSELAQLGYVQGQNLGVERFDLDFDGDQRKQQELVGYLAAHTDVIFATGNVLHALAQLPNLKTPVCFISTKETAATIPAGQQHQFTGVVRASFGSIIVAAQQIVPETKRLVMLGRAGSELPTAIKRYRQAAEGYDITLDFRLFSDKAEIGALMGELQEDFDIMLLFSPGLAKDDIAEIVHWQDKLAFPVLAQFERHVRAGLLAGMVIDMKKVAPKLAGFIDKIFQGRAADQLPLYYYPGKMVINLRTVNTLGREISTEITSRAEIIR